MLDHEGIVGLILDNYPILVAQIFIVVLLLELLLPSLHHPSASLRIATTNIL